MDFNKLNLRNQNNSAITDNARTILIGNTVSNSVFEQSTDNTLIEFKGTNGVFGLSGDQLSTGLMIQGRTGCGKTNTFFTMLDQIIPKMTDNDVMLIFDSKQDFMERYYEPDNEKHILISANEDHYKYAKSWNTFGELFDKYGRLGESAEIMSMEISKALFKELESSAQPFFHIAAADLFSAIISCFVKEAEESRDFSKLNNREVISFIKNSTLQDLYNMLNKYPKYRYLQSYLGDPKSVTPQALGVLGFLLAMVSSLFVGPFKNRMPSGQFSVRRLIREKRAKIIFLEYDVNLGKTLSPIYSLFIDLAIKEALSLGKGNTWVIADELNMLPYCERLQDAVNLGRGKGLKTIVGLQSISQLYNNYGEDEGKAIASGFVNGFFFNAVDYDTRKFVSERFGTTFENINWSGLNLTKEGYTVTDSDINNLQIGEAFIDLSDHLPFKFKFNKAD